MALSRARLLGGLAWLSLALAAFLVQGLPGHHVPFFSGDLAFHVATARTMQDGHLGGSGPYEGLPNYYGGAFPLLLALLATVGLDPSRALMAISWVEPALWVAAAATLARSIWPGRLLGQLAFAVFVCWGAGAGLGMTEQWVNAPDIAGQVFWPLFPRDVAFLLLLVALASALRGRWIVAGLLIAAGISFQAQIGLFTLGSCGLALLTVSPTGGRLKRAVGVTAVALLASSWWWLPRVVWSLRYGVALADSETRVDLAATPLNLWRAYAGILPLAAVGLLVDGAQWRRLSQTRRFLLWWAAVVVALLLVASASPGVLLSVRRALVLAAIPLTAIAVESVLALSEVVRKPRVLSPSLAVLVVVAVVAVSWSSLWSTRQRVMAHWADGRYGVTAYPNSAWDPVWRDLAHGDGPVLAAPSDSAMGWFRSGRPVLFMPRPGYVKLGFDAEKTTGWDEESRKRDVTSAFLHGGGALCTLAKDRGAGSLLLRSRAGGLGVIDFSGGTAVSDGLTSPTAPTIDRNNVVVAVVPRRGRVDLGPMKDARTHFISVWQAAGTQRATFSLAAGHRRVRPTRVVTDGAGQRLDFADVDLDGHGLRLVNRTGRELWLVRAVGFARWPSARAPATVVSPGELCRSLRP